MRKEYVLNGLDCANCAGKIENAVKNTDGINSATLNFINTTLQVEISDSAEKQMDKKIEDIVHKFEPDIIVEEKQKNVHNHDHEEGHTHGEGDGKRTLIRIIAGSALFILGIILQELLDTGIYTQFLVFFAAYLILGTGVVLQAAKNIARGQIFDENFLMSIATIGAFIIGNFPEAVAVMLFYQVGEYFQDMAVSRSKKSITDLMDIRPDFANLRQDKELVQVDPVSVSIGDIIVVKPGEKIPLDGVIIEGESMLDTTALTGESVPRRAGVDDEVLSGCINQNGVLTIKVTKEFGESTVAKIIDLVENASSKKAPTENFITTFSRYYTPVVVALAALLAIVPPLLFGGILSEWVNRGLIFLVISCPCALVVSIPLGFFGGIGRASKKGVLVKGSNYLEALNSLDTVVFDKTGTLTEGIFDVTSIEPANGFTKDALLEYAANAEVFSNHPIALSIQKAYGKEVNREFLSDYNEISGHGISVCANGKMILAGNDKLMKAQGCSYSPSSKTGTKIYVAVDNVYGGCIVISDKIKQDSKKAISGLKRKGIRRTVMLTGDNSQTAHEIADELGLDQVYAELLPDQKVDILERLDKEKSIKGKLAFVGDGINDAPVLARADIGIAMGGLGSDAAIEAADIVIMTDEPSKILDAIDIAGYTKRIVWQNIIFALSVKGIILLLGALGYASMWGAVFADVGVSVLAILNSMRVLRWNAK